MLIGERSTASILLVDDHPLMRAGLRALLESEPGLSVVGEAADGEAAVERAKAVPVDVVIMDVTMPGMSGIEATRRIRAQRAGTRVVALSMHAEKGFVDDMLTAGATAYVLKDSAPEELVHAVHAALRGESFLSAPVLDTVVSEYREWFAAGGARTGAAFIQQTKLLRPALPADLVPRTKVLERLDAGRDLPLTLVSAPAGYGKTLSIASWLDRCEWPHTWLALDAADGDLRQFIRYAAAAVRCLFAGACEDTLRIVSAPDLPPVSVVAATLCNDLERLDQSVVLVLDDYHSITAGSPVNELMQHVLARPPAALHLVVITRRDPPIPLHLLRSRGQVNEIRMRDLRFDAAEARALLEGFLGCRVSDEALTCVEQELEGWVAGLRLVTLALPKGQDPTATLQRLRPGGPYAQQYLIHEVLARQPAGMRDWLLKSAILDRFCEALCAAVCADPADPETPPFDGASFVATLCDENLFVIPLDVEGEWFRYHPLFQELLAAELRRTCDPERITALHVRASAWFESAGLFDEANRHALAAGDVERARELMEPRVRAVADVASGRVMQRAPGPVVQGHVDVANAGPDRPQVPAGRSGPDDLTNREIDIVQLLAKRLQNKEIADRLSIAPQTVNYHLKHIYDKLGVQSRRHAVRRAAEKGLLGVSET